MPRRVLRVALALLGVFTFMAVCGSTMPREHLVMESVVVPAAPEVVYQAVRDVESAAAWRSDVDRVEILPEKEDGRVYREIGDDGATVYEITEDEPNQRVVTRIADVGRSYSGHWVFQFEPAEGGGTRVTLTEVGDVPNPTLRFLGGAVFGFEGAIKQYLADLQQHLARA